MAFLGGLLGGDQTTSQGLLGGLNTGINNFAQKNPYALLAASGALLSGEGYGGAGRAFAQGSLADTANRRSDQQAEMAKIQAQREQTLFDQQQEDRRAAIAQKNVTEQWFQKNYPQYADAPTEVRNAVLKSLFNKEKLPTSVQEYQFAVDQGYDQPYQQWVTEKAKAGASNINLNNEQAKAAGFADRMVQSEQVLRNHELAGTSTKDRMLGAIPGAGNFLTSDEFKLFDQAKRDFINAALRRESGAVISDSEFENAERQYFPQPGDSPQVIEQKRRNRENVIFGTQRAAGSAYEPNVVQPPASQASADPLGIR